MKETFFHDWLFNSYHKSNGSDPAGLKMDKPTVTEEVVWSRLPYGHPNRVAFTYERPMTDRELAEKELEDYVSQAEEP